jgi:MFS family permease
MPSVVKAGLCGFCAALFIITMSLAAANYSWRTPGIMIDQTNGQVIETTTQRVQAAYALTGTTIGLVIAAAGAAFAMLDDIGGMMPVKLAFAVVAMIALFFTAGAFGIWAYIYNSAGPVTGVGPARWKTEAAFEVITCFFWIIAVAFWLVDPIDGGGNEVPKFPALGVCAAVAVFAIVAMALQAADRAGRAGQVIQFGVEVALWRPDSVLSAWSLVGSVLAIIVGGAGAALVATDMWGKDEATFRYIRFGWVWAAGVSVFFLGGAIGIWSYYQNLQLNDQNMWTAFMKVEFSFDIITMVLLWGAVAVLAAFGAGAKN